jgi:hypothetical protein
MQTELEAWKISSTLDWRRMACPQLDGYDTNTICAMAASRGYVRPETAPGPHWLDGATLIDHGNIFLARNTIPAPLNHPNIETGASLLTLWPAMYAQCQRLIHRVAFFIDSRHNVDCIVGSVCGPGPDGFGSISTTVNNHVGVAEAIVHELAHHKLHAMGVDVEHAEALVLNDPAELYASPIRYDSTRPMSAVLHAQYSYVHIAAMDIKIVSAALDTDRDEKIVRQSLAVILSKLAFGRQVLNSHAELDDAGTEFMVGFDQWTNQVLRDGFAILQKFAVDPVPFQHPLLKEEDNEVVGQENAASDLPTDRFVPELRPKPKGDIESHVVADGMVLYSPSGEAAYSLNGESRAIWELFDGVRTIEQIAQQLLLGLGIEEDETILAQLVADVTNTVHQSEADDLLVQDKAGRN